MNRELPERRLVLGTATGRTGEVMETKTTSHGPRVWLRPVGGGTEWTTTPDDLRDAQPEEIQP